MYVKQLPPTKNWTCLTVITSVFLLVFSVTEEYFLTVADKLRPFTAKAMKMEPAPWIRDYVVDMDELYTELALEKIDNKPFGQERKKLENYKELFAWHNPGMLKYFIIMHYLPDWRPTRKILIKADPGMGKTSLVKKITWDWAKRLFGKVSIVFFVFLKLVKPEDIIENAIIKQTPVLEGMGITKEKLRGILENFGDRCLLMLDGLDEHALGQNGDVHKIIRGAKILNCNVVLTSRPHSTVEIERYFEIIVRVEGFTRDKARKFASRIVVNEGKVADILGFKPIGIEDTTCLHSVPILLSILCLLVRENDIDLSLKTMDPGKLYAKMMRCLYKKYAVRKGIPFEMSSFCKALKLIGKIAFETLLSNNPFFQRKEISRLVGEEAFDYGLLIGHEDFRLIEDETADVFVTFPHRSLQEFLGAFYFVLMLNEGVDVDTLLGKFCRKPIFLMNPLFLQFCIWIIDNLETVFSVRETVNVKDVLLAHVAKILDKSDFDMNEIERKFPNISTRNITNNTTRFTFYVPDILAHCHNVENLIISREDLIDQALYALRPAFKHLKSIHDPYVRKKARLMDVFSPMFSGLSVHDKSDLDVFLTAEIDIRVFYVVLKHCRYTGHYPGVNLCLLKRELGNFNFTHILDEDLKGLHLFGSYQKFCYDEDIACCPFLEQLCLRQMADEDIFVIISKAIQQKLFPNLRHLTFVECFFNMEGKLSVLFRSSCLTLKHLGLYDFKLDQSDLEFLASVNADSEKSVLPNLSSLGLSTVSLRHSVASISALFSQSWTRLTSITFADATVETSRAFLNVINKGKLPNLVELKMSSRGGAEVDFDILKPERVTKLESLTLARIVTSSTKLEQLVQKIIKWKLRTLNLSYNVGISGSLSAFMTQTLPALKSLTLRCCELQSDDMSSLAHANAEGKFPELEYLDVLDNSCKQAVEYLTRDPSCGRKVTWKNVKYDESDDESDDQK